MNTRYIPALSFKWLTPLYDPLLIWVMREETFKRKLVQQANIQPKMKVLDLGCGTGEQIEELLGMGFEVVGLEPSSNMRNHAGYKLPPRTVVDGSILHIPFPHNSFDCVYAIEVLRYLDHHDNLNGLKEIYRVLKPNGIFFGTFVNRYAADGFVIITAMRTLLEKIFNKPQTCHVEFTAE